MTPHDSRRRLSVLATGLLLLACGDSSLALDEEARNEVAQPLDRQTFRLWERSDPLSDLELPAHALRGSGVQVQLNAGALGAARLQLVMPEGRALTAARKHSSQTADSRTWVGEFDGAPGSALVVTEHAGAFAGTVTLGARTLELQTDSKGSGRLFEVDERRLPELEPRQLPVADGEGTALATAPLAAEASAGAVIDLMVVYTPASRLRYGKATLEAKIIAAVDAANQAYRNSFVNQQLNLVYLAEVPYTESGDMNVTLNAMVSTNDGALDGLHATRNEVGADLVAMVDEDGGYCGLGHYAMWNGAAYPSYAFSVTASGCLSNHTLAHELGHNMGNAHDRANASSPGFSAYSYGLQRCASDGTGFRTVMAYACTGAVRVLQFSNPQVLVNGYPTGIAYTAPDAADNARSMNLTAAAVASFRVAAPTAPPAAPTGLSASALSDTQVRLAWTDASNDETGFRVERSSDGVTFTQIATTGQNATSFTESGLSALTTAFYRVRAYNSAGSSAYSAIASATTLPPPAAPPSAPGSVSVTASARTVTVRWADLSSDEGGFEIGREKLSRNGTWSQVAVVGKVVQNATSFVHTSSTGTYRYSVRSFNAGGASGWAGAVQVVVTRK